jgi:hypothetical protein
MSKDKGGRQSKTPKAAKNIKVSGQTPPPGGGGAVSDSTAKAKR